MAGTACICAGAVESQEGDAMDRTIRSVRCVQDGVGDICDVEQLVDNS